SRQGRPSSAVGGSRAPVPLPAAEREAARPLHYHRLSAPGSVEDDPAAGRRHRGGRGSAVLFDPPDGYSVLPQRDLFGSLPGRHRGAIPGLVEPRVGGKPQRIRGPALPLAVPAARGKG